MHVENQTSCKKRFQPKSHLACNPSKALVKGSHVISGSSHKLTSGCRFKSMVLEMSCYT